MLKGLVLMTMIAAAGVAALGCSGTASSNGAQGGRGAPPAQGAASPLDNASTATPAGGAAGTPSAISETAAAPSGFSCSDQSGGVSSRSALTAVRIAQHPGYDRMVLQFDGPVPKFAVKRQASPSFVHDASGRPFVLAGSAGVLIRMEPASGQGSYSGPTDLKPGLSVVREASLAGDFEAVEQWGVGLSHAACMRTFALTSPSRLVVDFQAS